MNPESLSDSRIKTALDSGKQVFMRKSGGGGIITSAGNRDTKIADYSKTEVRKNTEIKNHAYNTGLQNMQRLANASPAELLAEVNALKDLNQKLSTAATTSYGVEATANWEEKGLALANASGGDYRSHINTEVGQESVDGWDETIQTSVAIARAGGRANAIHNLPQNTQDESDRRAQLVEIHQQMTIADSLVRSPTAGVAGEHDSDSTTHSEHTTSSSFLTGLGVGANPIGHRARSSYMQEKELDFVQAKPKALMADRQRVRITSALHATNNLMSAPTIQGQTNTRMNVGEKHKVMHETREGAKNLQRARSNSLTQTQGGHGRSPSPPR
jgi:hypothetical protein